jgi:hypothetical protein
MAYGLVIFILLSACHDKKWRTQCQGEANGPQQAFSGIRSLTKTENTD